MQHHTLIAELEMDCPICDKVHTIHKCKRMTQALIKEQVVSYEEIYFFCPESDEEECEFVPASLMDQNLLAARDGFRREKGLLTSAEIAEIRSYYGLTQSEYALLLGWGEVTITRYESKTIQDETYDNIMRMSRQNPLFALKSLQRHKDRFPQAKYPQVKETILRRLQESEGAYLTRERLTSLYAPYDEESPLNGHQRLDIDKLEKVLVFFASTVPDLYKVKLMKLLWYADAIFYQREAKGLTGLVYAHMPYGALPIGHNELLQFPTLSVTETYRDESVSYHIHSTCTPNPQWFTPEEWETLQFVREKFSPFTTRQIVDYMHLEQAYTQTRHKEMISYELCKDLNALKS